MLVRHSADKEYTSFFSICLRKPETRRKDMTITDVHTGPFLAAAIAIISMSHAAHSLELPQELIDCRTLPAADARLACYDRVVEQNTTIRRDGVASTQIEPPPAAPSTSTHTDTIAAESASVEKRTAAPAAADGPRSKEDLFGMSAEEQLRAVKMEEAAEEISEIEATIFEVRHTRHGKAVISLDSGQIWQQVDSQKMRLTKNDKVLIRRASFGSFLLKKVGSKRSIRVKRIG